MGNILSYFVGNEIDINFKKYGWRPDTPDHRDLYLVPDNLHKIDDVLQVDLRNLCPGIYNQGKLGSCTANAIAGMYEFDEIKQDENNLFIPSRLFIYYNERNMEDTINYDSGAQIRDGIKSVSKLGVCPETMWPYDISKFTEKPSDECYNEAKKNTAIKYHRVLQDLSHLKGCLNNGLPFVFGFAVYESFESEEVAKTGIMKMPTKDEKCLGGHAIMAVGYDDDKKVFIIRNSWGVEWGDKGYFYMPYEFILNKDLCSDFWVIQTIRDSK